jgi:adenylosuccinate lyase
VPARFTEAVRFRSWFDVGAALAGRAELGIIAEAARHEIARKAQVKYLDLSAVRAGLASIGAIAGVRSTPTPAAALRRAGRRHLRGVSQKGVM